MNLRQLGTQYETKTVGYMDETGYQILSRNVYTPFGEIDIVALQDDVYIFTEVKYRQNRRYGYGADAVNYYKKRHIIQASKWFLMKQVGKEVPVRYDVAVWTKDTLDYYKGAFHNE